jgi:hypothetical protein
MSSGKCCEATSESAYNPHIVFLLTHDIRARLVVKSGVAKRLMAQGAWVTVIWPPETRSYEKQDGSGLSGAPWGAKAVTAIKALRKRKHHENR